MATPEELRRADELLEKATAIKAAFLAAKDAKAWDKLPGESDADELVEAARKVVIAIETRLISAARLPDKAAKFGP